MLKLLLMTGASLLLASPLSAASVREERLDNGLRVLLKRVEGLPLVSVWSWIHAGSANEGPGITGAAHWCEHMNFKGTERYSREDLKNLLERRGGVWNGYTWLDQTAYYETLPRAALDLAVDIEAQRMSAGLFAPEAVTSERTVILSELQMGENDPENLLDIESNAVAFEAHPYRWPTIGWQSDIESMTRDQLRAFYRRHYCPRNATLVIAGDIDEDAALAVVRDKFGKIPPGELIPLITTKEPEQRGEKRVTVRRGGATAYIELLYHTPTVDSGDFYPLLALDALLGGAESVNLSGVEWRGQASKSSRLYRGLVDAGIAAKAGALYLPTKYPCLFCVYATAPEGVDCARLEGAVVGILDEARRGAVSDEEFQRVCNQIRARFVYDTEGITGQAQILGFFDTVGGYRLAGGVREGVAKLRKEDLGRVAKKYLSENNRTVGWYLPQDRMANDRGANAAPAGLGLARYTEQAGGDAPRARRGWKGWLPWQGRPLPVKSTTGAPAKAVPREEAPASSSRGVALRATRTVLKNGITLIVRENHTSPSAVVRIDIGAGSAYDPPGVRGLANFTARMLDRGSRSMSGPLIAEALDGSGTELQISCGRDRAVVAAQLLKEKLPMVVELLAQIVAEPVFPEAEIEKLKAQIVTSLQEAAHDTQQVAEDRAYECVYPQGHPYRHKVAGEIASVRSARRRDMLDFYRARYGPRAVTIVCAGDFSAEEVRAIVEKYFGGWEHAVATDAPPVLTPPLPPQTARVNAPVPDKTQVDIVAAQRGVARDNPDYYALQVMNSILGQFGMGGRLGRAIREERGLAYYAFSSIVPYRHVGPIILRAGVNPKNLDKAIEEMHGAL
ncbi:MAG: pitrilysin family protein, partial [Candidatus Aureabacteria bacterium]|nr:pitrilysin family protein [Candidatus Auribacterota bacterium]